MLIHALSLLVYPCLELSKNQSEAILGKKGYILTLRRMTLIQIIFKYSVLHYRKLSLLYDHFVTTNYFGCKCVVGYAGKYMEHMNTMLVRNFTLKC
jgi:hypothetical protein